MEQTVPSGNAKWGLAAKDGLILAAVTVVVSTLTLLTKNAFLSTLLWLVKLGGSIWLLSVIMKRYGKTHPDESTFGYGFLVCVFSAIVCSVWAFIEFQYLFPDAMAEALDQMYTGFEQMSGMLPEGFTDAMLKMEDNYAQVNCISTFIWCVLLGLLFSFILSRSSGRKNVFTDEEMKQNNDDFNF